MENKLTKEGIVKAKASKNGFNSFCFVGDDKVWFSSKNALQFEKGDKISLIYTETTNGNFTNRYISNYQIIEKSKPKFSGSTGSSFEQGNFRSSVDAGNQVANAKDILVALINKGEVRPENVVTTLSSLVDTMIVEFKKAKVNLEKQEEKETPTAKVENPVDEDFVERVKVDY